MGECKACGKKTIYLMRDKTMHDGNQICDDCYMTTKLQKAGKKVKEPAKVKESASQRLANLFEGGGKWFMKVTLDGDGEKVAEKYHLQMKDGLLSGTYKALKAFADETKNNAKIEKKVKPE